MWENIMSTLRFSVPWRYAKSNGFIPHGTKHSIVLMISQYMYHDIPHDTEHPPDGRAFLTKIHLTHTLFNIRASLSLVRAYSFGTLYLL